MDVISDLRCLDYDLPGHPERPARVEDTLDKLKSQEIFQIQWHAPCEVSDGILERGHSADYLALIQLGAKSAKDFDADTPAYPSIDAHARRGVGGALRALTLAMEGKMAFSLLRPPGHHAMQNRAMGFCYLNSIAISVLHAMRFEKRIAVFDFDVHHGNGTEAILCNRRNVAFYSVHQHPCYPGTGRRNVGDNCFNFPLPPQMPRKDYRKVIFKVIDAMAKWQPELIAVSAGFDAFVGDPLSQETLEIEDFFEIGKAIRRLGIPFFSILEGGYSAELSEIIFAYLCGIA